MGIDGGSDSCGTLVSTLVTIDTVFMCVSPNILQGVIPSATLEEQRGRELRYLLPLHQSRPSVLSRLFKQLELQQGVLGVSSYGLTTCSMEEVREGGVE